MIHKEENQQGVHGWCWGLPLWYPLSPHYQPLGVYGGGGRHNWLQANGLCPKVSSQQSSGQRLEFRAGLPPPLHTRPMWCSAGMNRRKPCSPDPKAADMGRGSCGEQVLLEEQAQLHRRLGALHPGTSISNRL